MNASAQFNFFHHCSNRPLLTVLRLALTALLVPSGMVWCLGQTDLSAPSALEAIRQHLLNSESALTDTDWRELTVTDLYAGKKSGLTYCYVQQAVDGIPVQHATGTAIFDRSGDLRVFNSRLVAGLPARLGPSLPTIDSPAALLKAAELLEISLPDLPIRILEEQETARRTTSFDPEGIALEPVTLQLIWAQAIGGQYRLAWEVSWYTLAADHRWVLWVDANTGEELDRHDLVLYCDFGSPDHAHEHPGLQYDMRGFEHAQKLAASTIQGSSYRVFPVPVESPIHGASEIVVNPADTIASPWGWHDTDGQPGAEYTITRGNNVHAYSDALNLNESIGDEPDGGPELVFDFPFNPDAEPETYQDAAVTNLFYWCNIVHDVWYHYGFDEPAGNFQFNNFGLGGEEGDDIQAEAQDGSGLNNANFSSEGDGTTARVQMYLFKLPVPAPVTFQVLTPDTIAEMYEAIPAQANSFIENTVITGQLVQAIDGNAPNADACEPILNVSQMEGNIALIDRGGCDFRDQIVNAQIAGAEAVIICNTEPGQPFTMSGLNAFINIPAAMISQEDCMTLKAFLNAGVTAEFAVGEIVPVVRDGDFDNGIISHEYAHGLSTRMTGGPSTGLCLLNEEQMGEGWSDYASLVLTMQPGDSGEDIRGVGTFAINQPPNGGGIRPAPYSTDFSVNPFTYDDTNNPALSVPHGVGFVWATVLWDLTWDLIDLYGFDEDLTQGEGGNNIAIQLVTEGMKLQVCNPGMLDGRDAILLADLLLYDGEHWCLIYKAFANRGFGYSASQGSAFSRFDQIEAFDLPPVCLTPTTAPTALIAPGQFQNCTGEFQFEDASVNVPQEWLWDFGDGNTSQEQHPEHSYANPGTYTVVLTVSNAFGSSSDSVTVEAVVPDAPIVFDQSVCEGETAMLVATSPGLVNWYLDDDLILIGDTLIYSPAVSNFTFEVQTEIPQPIQSVGPEDNSFGPGTYVSSDLTGSITFEAQVPLVIESVWVDAVSAGERVIELYNSGNELVDVVSVFIPEGQNTVKLNLQVPGPGDYFLACTTSGLYVNQEGANFPYVLDDILTLASTLSGSEYYYFFYNWQVREASCFSPLTEVSIEVLPTPVAGFAAEQLSGGLVQFSDSSTGATAWLWQFGDGNTSLEQNPTHLYDAPGDYQVALVVASGACTDALAQLVTVEPTVGTGQLDAFQSVQLLPNTGDGHFRLVASGLPSGSWTIRIAAASGQFVDNRVIQSAGSIDESFDISELPAGVYLVTLSGGAGMTTVRYIHIGS